MYLARQPIVDRESKLRAYEILYRDSDRRSKINSDRQASVSVINSIFNRFGTNEILDDKRGFIKIDKKFLLNDLIFTIPDKFFVFALLDSIEMDERVVERVQQLHERGYVIVINDIKFTEASMQKYREIFDYLSFIKIDFEQELEYGLGNMILELKSHGISVVATKIENAKMYNQARKLGCEWFQGYFFAEPKVFTAPKYEVSQVDVFNLYNLLIEDTSLDDITLAFEKKPEITVQLLQFINTDTFHVVTKISSVHNLLTLVSRQRVADWLMLMIYSKSGSKKREERPLMLQIKNRTELMKHILITINPEARSNMLGEAYLVGMLSLIDQVFEKNLEDILESTHISDTIKSAILHESDILGDILKLVKEIESSNKEAEIAFETRYGLRENAIKELVAESLAV
ncbi:MAG: EAL domain-containing protein [Campylobacterota bacterium]|nr:EAL domain-containing protein [Campylobacterota bacterium]